MIYTREAVIYIEVYVAYRRVLPHASLIFILFLDFLSFSELNLGRMVCFSASAVTKILHTAAWPDSAVWQTNLGTKQGGLIWEQNLFSAISGCCLFVPTSWYFVPAGCKILLLCTHTYHMHVYNPGCTCASVILEICDHSPDCPCLTTPKSNYGSIHKTRSYAAWPKKQNKKKTKQLPPKKFTH